MLLLQQVLRNARFYLLAALPRLQKTLIMQFDRIHLQRFFFFIILVKTMYDFVQISQLQFDPLQTAVDLLDIFSGFF